MVGWLVIGGVVNNLPKREKGNTRRRPQQPTTMMTIKIRLSHPGVNPQRYMRPSHKSEKSNGAPDIFI